MFVSCLIWVVLAFRACTNDSVKIVLMLGSGRVCGLVCWCCLGCSCRLSGLFCLPRLLCLSCVFCVFCGFCLPSSPLTAVKAENSEIAALTFCLWIASSVSKAWYSSRRAWSRVLASPAATAATSLLVSGSFENSSNESASLRAVCESKNLVKMSCFI